MIGDVIDTSRITTLAIKKMFRRRSRIETSICYSVSVENLASLSLLSRLRKIQCLGSLHIKQHENKQEPAKANVYSR